MTLYFILFLMAGMCVIAAAALFGFYTSEFKFGSVMEQELDRMDRRQQQFERLMEQCLSELAKKVDELKEVTAAALSSQNKQGDES